jgi:hypothetical protein
MTCKTTLVYYLLYITTVCPTPHFSPLVNNNSSILDLINSLMLDGGLLLIPQPLVISTDNGLSSVPSMRKE